MEMQKRCAVIKGIDISYRKNNDLMTSVGSMLYPADFSVSRSSKRYVSTKKSHKHVYGTFLSSGGEDGI